MVMTLGKEMKISPRMNNCNILARESFKDEQLKNKSLKIYSPHRKSLRKSLSFGSDETTMLVLK
jgi:hypothetical protein